MTSPEGRFFRKSRLRTSQNVSDQVRAGELRACWKGSKPMTFIDFHIDLAGICWDDPIFCQICCESIGF
jgi:hypothetical protein